MTPEPWWSLAATGVVAITFVALAITLPHHSNYPEDPVTVAFVGDSIIYYNDCPRFMEALSMGHIKQNSCLHGGATLSSILLTGNGMLFRWNSTNAVRADGTYDLGACSVPQLLLGYDDNLDEVAFYEASDDDTYGGTNPCSTESYVLPDSYQSLLPWDYVVMNDHTLYPGIAENREATMETLRESYLPWFLETGATPVFLATHAYECDQRDTSMFDGIPGFTSETYYGYRLYADVLGNSLPESQAPLVAPVGIAFLTVYEEDPDMWLMLFGSDSLHASPHGSYLQGCVLHATIFGTMPYRESAFRRDFSQLWSRARVMAPVRSPILPLPTLEEARYLFDVAERVVLNGYRPSSFVEYFDQE